jgi:hypothetical protein
MRRVPVKNKNDETEWHRRVETRRLKQRLGLASIAYHDLNHPIAITDVSLENAVASAGADRRPLKCRRVSRSGW